MALTQKTEKYLKDLQKEVKKVYEVAEVARAKGLDPVDKVEIPLAMNMAEKVEGLISTIYPQLKNSGVVKRILELEKEYGKLDPTVVFKISEEVAKQKFCEFSSLREAIDAGIRVGFAYQTIAVVASPLEGYTKLKIEKTNDGKEYFKVYFSGPIRSAGTTASCIVLMIIDYLREVFGYAKYDPTEDEVKRYVTEIHDYHERVTNLQYMPVDEEIEFLAKNLPIQIAGEPTERREVSNYKNLERVESDFIRGGMCLIFAEGLAQKAAKGFRLLNKAKSNGVESTGWDFLAEYIELHENIAIKGESGEGEDTRPTYIRDLVAGRPVYGHPSRSGSFRFRYGRARNSGFSASCVSPATMVVTDDFIATGTQLKIEKPTKGTAVTPCDSIDGPIVKLFDGSVKKLNNFKEAKEFVKDVEEIIYIGDLLMPFSDVVNRNSMLLKPGYVEEWWELELEKLSKGNVRVKNYSGVGFEEAVELSKKFGVPLHPEYIFYWTQISKEFFNSLINWFKFGKINGKIILPYTKEDQETFKDGKRALELLGVEHEVTIENVVISEKNSKALFANLGLDFLIFGNGGEFKMKELVENKKEFFENSFEKVLEIVQASSDFVIKDKAGEFIGARMGRPEKAKLRKLQGSPNILFPIGNEGGRLRSVQEACSVGTVRSSWPLFSCEACGTENLFPNCQKCGGKCKKEYYFFETKEKSSDKTPKSEGGKEGKPYNFRDFPIQEEFEKAVKNLKLTSNEIPALIKGVRGMSSESKIPEHLEKGILRAKYNLQVNKDGTIRYDGTELPISHFKPQEVFIGVEKLKELGYTEDIHGKPLETEDQTLEMMPHDIILPVCPVTSDEKADDVFFNVSKFVDEELEKFYGLKSFHNLKTKEDLAGQLGVFMAPHNCAGVICRFIGFSKNQALNATSYMHAAVRRDCDGDEAAVMLLSDVLLNFSREFLPSHRGGTQDAPLVLNARIDAGEVDDQILDLEVVPGGKYPLELYELAEQGKHSSEVKSIVDVAALLKEDKDPFINLGFTHGTEDFNKAVNCSSYKTLATMAEKVGHQMALVEKLRGVDTSDTARLIIERHFIRDMRGNLRSFSQQNFRCVKCNEILRRPPLKGVCPKCQGKIIFTIHEGGIKKYLEPALELAEKYHLSPYLVQSLELTKRFIDSIFGKEVEKQEALGKWF